MKRPYGREESTDRDAGALLGGRPRPSLGRFAVGTTALTFALVLLGIWTAIAGFGLTCGGRWPLCDGAVFGLFPAKFGSFVEWFHRFVAMLTGFAILGTAAGAWRAGATRRVRAAYTAAVVLTPVQVVLGALTVTRYEQLILAAHFGIALAILTLLVAGTVWLLERPLPAEDLGGLAAGTFLGALALAPGTVVAAQSIGLHVAYYALALGGYVALLALAVAPGDRHPGLRGLTGGGALVLAVGATLGRVRFDPTARLLVAGCLVLALLLAVATVLASHYGVLERERVGPTDF